MSQPSASDKIIKRIRFDPEFQPVLMEPVIKQRVISACEEAKEIVAAARQEAARIRREAGETVERAERERQAERVRGHEEGYQEGLGQLTEKMVEVVRSHERILSEAEPQVVRMVMDIAEKVIGREIEKGAVLDIVKHSIQQAVGKKVVVRINPADVAAVKQHQAQLFSVLGQGQTVNVREDDGIPAGGCVVETEMGTVDARLETQLKAIKKALGLEGA